MKLLKLLKDIIFSAYNHIIFYESKRCMMKNITRLTIDLDVDHFIEKTKAKVLDQNEIQI